VRERLFDRVSLLDRVYRYESGTAGLSAASGKIYSLSSRRALTPSAGKQTRICAEGTGKALAYWRSEIPESHGEPVVAIGDSI